MDILTRKLLKKPQLLHSKLLLKKKLVKFLAYKEIVQEIYFGNSDLAKHIYAFYPIHNRKINISDISFFEKDRISYVKTSSFIEDPLEILLELHSEIDAIKKSMLRKAAASGE